MKDTASEMPADQFKPEELFSIMIDAIKADKVEFVRIHCSTMMFKSFVETAARTASPTMVDLLLEYSSTLLNAEDDKEYALKGAIVGENMVVIKHLIARGANLNLKDNWVIKGALRTYNTEIVELLLDHGAHLVESPYMFNGILVTGGKRDEDEAFKVLHRMHKYVVGKKAFSNGLSRALEIGSIPLAKYFVENGADVNSGMSGSSYPALYNLVKKFSPRDAETIKFLLQKGADPYLSSLRRRSIKSLAGMKKVEQYFDKSWDDLVREAQTERASTTNEG